MSTSTVRAALTELVECHDLKARIDNFNPDVDDHVQARQRYKDYHARKPGAWLTARVALAEPALHPVEINSMALANAITKVLTPDQYGKDMSAFVMRNAIFLAIKAELAMQAEVFE